MIVGRPAKLTHSDPETNRHSDTFEASGRRNRPILLYAAPGSGAENLMCALSHLKSLTLVRGSHFPIDDATWTISCFGKPPLLPGLHFLADYHVLLKALRRMMDSIIDVTCEKSGSLNSTRLIYSPGNIPNMTTLRQLYPDALHVHLVRDISSDPLRMAAEANLPIWILCKRWRQSERAFSNSPPLPTRVTVRYEELEHAPAETVDSFMRLAGLSLTAADQDALSEEFFSASTKAYFNRRHRWHLHDAQSSPVRRIRERIAARCAAVYCQAELAALQYKTSLGRPGLLHTFAVAAALKLISRTDISRRPSYAEDV
jgi:hypothetical protein